MPLQQKAIIIGSGVAGLATAIRLAVLGLQVTVFEKNSYPGGKLSSIQQDGFYFDAGPSLFIQPSNIEELFLLAGEPIEKYFTYRPVAIACRYFYEDGTVINAYTNKQDFAEELQAKTGEAPERLYNYLSRSEKLYQNTGAFFLQHSLHKAGTLLSPGIVKALYAVQKKYLLNNLNQVNSHAFSQPHVVQLFNRYATYNGSNPYKAPGMLSLIPHLEHNEGVFYPEGGMISITNALYKLALKKGVTFQFNTAVEKIMISNNHVQGVSTPTGNHDADIVVSNMDVYFTYKELLKNSATAARLLKQERSSSALIFYWGMAREFPQLDLHNIFFSADYQAEFEHLFRYKTLYHDPTVYINITSKYQPAQHAPQGMENWFVMINVPANNGQNWQQLKADARQYVLSKLSRLLQTSLQPLIETEAILDPIMIEDRTSSFMGALYGTSSNSRYAAFLRHPNFSKTIKGLYFAGGSVHPGGGIPLCLKSAAIVSNLIAAHTRQHN
ncbi:1-hydroxycarotenoid 3,4-desaturase CrtD [Foetidibacter luteolus]|uniref:1-hydroxycarotenoid 3,4-desaturase CrtD n=1 Tax=Foetidibacter luteolus TaxID=2608880 RepID=UPI00129BD456|nr:1-hydroxycarotenoid 3,4-desaturase CrtD [Foetidibacter luteolus]